MGTIGQHNLYNTATETLHRMTMWAVLSSTDASPMLFPNIAIKYVRLSEDMVNALLLHASIVYQWSSAEADGVQSLKFVHGGNGRPYHRFVLHVAKDFIHSVRTFCATHQ